MNISFFNSIYELFLLNPVAQSVGFVATLFVWLAFLYSDDLKTIKLLLISNIFWGLTFFLLQSYTGLIAVIIAILRLILSIKYKKNFKVFLFLIIITLIFGFIACDSYISLLPIIGSLVGIYGFFYLSGIAFRIGCLTLSVIWLIYSLLIGSIGGVINEIVVELLIIITLYKYVGVKGYKLIFISKIKSIFHPHHNVDYGRYIVIKDKNKL